MKKYLLLILTVSIFAFISCSDEDDVETTKTEKTLDQATKEELAKAHQTAEDAAVKALMATADKVAKGLAAMKAKNAAEKAYVVAQAAGANYKKLEAAGDSGALAAGAKALAAKAEATRLVGIAKLAGAALEVAKENANKAKAASVRLYAVYKEVYNKAYGIG